MRKMATAVFFALCALLAVGPRPVHAQILLFDYVGFDYEGPNPDGSMFGEVGSGYVGLGEVPNLFLPLTADPANNYYTYHISGLTAVSRMDFVDFVIVDYGSGTLSIYEDSKTTGTLAVYGENPPNATAPGTFADGNLFLQGTLTSFRVVFSTFSNAGSYEGEFDVTGGSQYSLIPEDQRHGWTFSGFTGNATSIAPGYEHQVDGQVFLEEPTPAKLASWGTIKARYR